MSYHRQFSVSWQCLCTQYVLRVTEQHWTSYSRLLVLVEAKTLAQRHSGNCLYSDIKSKSVQIIIPYKDVFR